MPKKQLIAPGQCLLSLAEGSGHTWETIWNDPANAALKERRKDPRVLQEGDTVVIPDLRPKKESRAPDARYTFKRLGVPSKLRMRIQKEGEPLANATFECHVGPNLISGATDGDGILEFLLPPGASEARLVVKKAKLVLQYHLLLGHLDPADSVKGVQGRLRNLGFYAGALDGTLNSATRRSLRQFQQTFDLQVSGEPDDPTKDKLKSLHGS